MLGPREADVHWGGECGDASPVKALATETFLASELAKLLQNLLSISECFDSEGSFVLFFAFFSLDFTY